jgi:hypothetical protein
MGPKLLIGVGLFLVVAGIIWWATGRFLPWGRLPGDIVVDKGQTRFYFPIVTCLVISILGSLLLSLFRFFNR